MFRRKIEDELRQCYQDTNSQKILIVYGARQVGKSGIIRETASQHDKHHVGMELIDPSGNYRLKAGVVLGNKNIVAASGNLLFFPIYMAMFL